MSRSLCWGGRGEEGGRIDVLVLEGRMIVPAGYLALMLESWIDYHEVHAVLHH